MKRVLKHKIDWLMRVIFIFISLIIIENELVAFPSQSVNDVENFNFSIVSTANCSSIVVESHFPILFTSFPKISEPKDTLIMSSLRLAAKTSTKLFGKAVQQTTTRIGRDGKAVEIIFKNGSKLDINAARVKQWIPNTHPKAPAGALQRVKFPNSLPGSKGFKRLPTQ